MPFLLLKWLSANPKCLRNPAIALLRKVFVYGKDISKTSRITWQEFEEFVAIFEAVKTMFLCQRGKSLLNYSSNEPMTINLSDYFNVEHFLPDVILPQNVNVYKSMEQFPRKKNITDSRTGKLINWKCEASPVIINGNSTEFADTVSLQLEKW